MIVNNPNNVARQFKNDGALSYRMSFYEKYDTSPTDYPSWLFEKYKFFQGCSILELGCGNGRHWESRIERLPEKTSLILSDISMGMLSDVSVRFPDITIKRIDAQSIPYDDKSFDFVIANHMLFHVPDLGCVLSEIYRVLKDGGILYAATDSNNGMREFFRKIIEEYDIYSSAFSEQLSFNAENGEKILIEYFDKVRKYEYAWPLSVTDPSDIIIWLKSTEGISGYISKHENDYLIKFKREIKNNGYVTIPKKCALFVAEKNVCMKMEEEINGRV